ncbi:glycosyltransferase family 4 protein [Vibrio genomosp. F6]|uniref:glycosyltransferase family 4 protein n=1 Tax=Vibrio genomosp. F6 TaxID=723172 RepID=UPI001482785E|nr:glycosyltransferase family 4 protein [Vibrio genomosp. F6]
MLVCVGPIPEPITGQSLAFETYVRNSKFKPVYFDTSTDFGKSLIAKSLSRLRLFFSFFIFIATNNATVMYITTSRSNFGFISDSVFMLLFKCICKGKIVNHLHGADFVSFRESSKLKRLIDYVYRCVDKSIVLTDSMVEQYSNYKNMEIEIVENFSQINISSIELNEKCKSILKGNEIKILYMSNIMYSKGITHLVSAIEELNSSGFNVKLIVCGDYASDDFLSKIKIKNQFEILMSKFNFIEYRGVIQGAQKKKVFFDSDIFCLPTFYKTEAQPLSIFEAMGCGCQVVTTKHNYIPSYINDKEAYLAEPRDVFSLFKEIKKAIEDRDSEMIRKNYEKILTVNSIQNHVERVDRLIEEF